MEKIIINFDYNDQVLNRTVGKGTIINIDSDKRAKKAVTKDNIITVSKERAQILTTLKNNEGVTFADPYEDSAEIKINEMPSHTHLTSSDDSIDLKQLKEKGE